tara:strand:- start:4869 stop:7811 length:2943 start_codon:yes stop_codon:yes gene_type:complete
MKAVLNLAYLINSPSLGTVSKANSPVIDTLNVVEKVQTTVAQELLAALGKISTSSAVFSALNMGSPLIKSLSLDLLFRNYEKLFDTVNLDTTEIGFDANKFLEDIPEVSDIAGKLLSKSGIFDLLTAVDDEDHSILQGSRLDDIAQARADLLPFYVEKGLGSGITFDEDIFIKWESSLIVPHVVEAEELVSLLYGERLDESRAVGSVLVEALRAELPKETLEIIDSQNEKILELSFTNFKRPYLYFHYLGEYRKRETSSTIGYAPFWSEEGQGPITERDTDLATIESARWGNNEFPGTGIGFEQGKDLQNNIKLAEVPQAFRPLNPEDITSFEHVDRKLTKINFSKFKRPYRTTSYSGSFIYYNTSANSGLGSHEEYKREGQGPIADRDTELAVLEAARWGDNEIPGVGLSLEVPKRLNTTIELSELLYPTRPIDVKDSTDFEEVARKSLDISFTEFKRPYIITFPAYYQDRYKLYTTTSPYPATPSFASALSRGPNQGPFTTRDTDLAAIASARWHNNEIPGQGLSIENWKRALDELTLIEDTIPSKISNPEESILNEDSTKMVQTLDFIGNKSFELDQYNRKVWSDGVTHLQYVPGDEIYVISSGFDYFWSDIVGPNETWQGMTPEEVIEDAPNFYTRGNATSGGFDLYYDTVTQRYKVRLWLGSGEFLPGTYITVVSNPTQINNSKLTERDGELVSVYSGRDTMSFQLPLPFEVENFSAETEYVIPTKTVEIRKINVAAEENIEEFFIDKTLLNKSLVYVPYDHANGIPAHDAISRTPDLIGLDDTAGKLVDKEKFLESISTSEKSLVAKAVLPTEELFSTLSTIEDRLILKNILQYTLVEHPGYYVNQGTNMHPLYVPPSYTPEYDPFRVMIEEEYIMDIQKPLKELLGTTSVPETYRPFFGFEDLAVSESSKEKTQKRPTEELLDIISTFYRQVEYRRDYQSENALADDTLSGFSQNYSSGYFSQAYVGVEITGD